MPFFKNLFVIFFITLVFYKSIYFFFTKKKEEPPKKSAYFAFLISFLILPPLASIFVGFDIAVAGYVLALIFWLLVDLMHISVIKRRKGKK